MGKFLKSREAIVLNCFSIVFQPLSVFSDLIDKQIKVVDHNSDIVLESIREDIRTLLPLNGVTPTEKICTPSVGPVSFSTLHGP